MIERTIYRAQRITIDLIRELSRATPPAKPREIRDKQAGLILRHQPSNYLGLYANLGRGKRERLCDARRILDPQSAWTLGKARADARRLKVQHSDGRDFSAERKADRAIPDLKTFIAETYGPWVRQNRRSGDATLARIESLFIEDYGKTRLTELTPARLETWRVRRQKSIKPETLVRDINALRGVLSRAVKLKVIDTNPLAGVEMPEIDKHKQDVRALSADEKARLIEALEARDSRMRERRVSANKWRAERGYAESPKIGRFADPLTPAVITSLETGLRRGELLSLEWPAVNFNTKTLRVRGSTAKTYESREVPLNKLCYQTLRDLWLQSEQPRKGYVFVLRGKPVANFKKSYHGVLASAGIKRINSRGERVNWHSLRHTFGTLLGAAGVDPATLMKLMGHANLATTQRYLHTDSDRKRAAVELLSQGAAKK